MAPILPEQVPVEVLLHAPCDIVQFARMQLDLEPGIDPLKAICVHITKPQLNRAGFACRRFYATMCVGTCSVGNTAARAKANGPNNRFAIR